MRADREWVDMQLPKRHYLFHSYEMVNPFGYSHQIDTLFISKHFVLVMETKDIGGQIDFDDKVRQMIQTKAGGTKMVYESPTNQELRYQRLIEGELLKIGVNVPAVPVVVFTDPKTCIATSTQEVDVFRLSGLQSKVSRLFEQYPATLGEELLDYVKAHFMACYQKLVLKRICPKVSVLKGVVCPCCWMQMKHERKGVRCMQCGTKTTNGVYEALHKYQLLYKDGITNQEFQDFLGVESIYTVSRMLSKLGIDYMGISKTENM
ncbi:nuclease-related domain-containing protein [Lysinibacillus sp. KU-BSD001]|uniref:nuclease-related domain-containing protein n=1 Tax=Lysinibacillus sp. KU-BSD001 TaxID=3141328 RepID=UPI0036E59A5B